MRVLCPAIVLAALCSSAVRADCDASNQFNFDWNSQPQTQLNYAGSYTYTVTNPVAASRTFVTTFVTNGVTSPSVAGVTMPVIAAVNTGTLATTEQTLTMGGTLTGRTPDISGATRVVAVNFAFSAAVRDVAFRIFDVDQANDSYRDWVKIIGRNGAASYNPLITKPAASTVRIGPSATAPAIGAGEVLGTSGSNANEDIGTIQVSFAQPVTSVEVRYGNYPLQTGETQTGQQWISIHDIGFCPMPILSVTKTSAAWSDPLNGTTNPKLVPGADLRYTLTISNTGGSPVDLSTTVLTDPLPASVTFFNGDIDDGGPLTTNFAFLPGATGLTMAPANLAYSNNAGTSYAYTPTANYDAAVNAVKIAPQGLMAANSSFSVSFRVRIK